MPRAKSPRCEMVSDGRDLFIVFGGLKIAKRGRPWHAAGEDVDLARAGYRVLDSKSGIVVEYKAPRRDS